MKWWYEPQKEHYKWSDYDSVVFAIATLCRFEITYHTVPNYYIYNENGLVNIIKGSEIDPLSITRESNYLNSTFDEDIQLSEYNNLDTFEDNWKRINQIINGTYKRTEEQLQEIQECLNLQAEFELADDDDFNLSYVKEYDLKNGYGNVTDLFVKHIHSYPNRFITDINSKDNNIVKEITDDFLVSSFNYFVDCYVLAYRDNKILGVYCIKEIKDNTFISDVLKFLLLIGANNFILVHYDLNIDDNIIQVLTNLSKAINVNFEKNYEFSL